MTGSHDAHVHVHGFNSNSVVMRRPDGTPMSRQEVIVERRGAFKWLPVLCSNDLTHGSWWFVWGSFAMVLTAIVPIIQQSVTLYQQEDDFLPAIDYDITWSLLISVGIFYTLGSLAFVRAFEEPPKLPLLHNYYHFQTDELLGAWLFLIGTSPSVPYMFVFFSLSPSILYMTGLILAGVMVFALMLFVLVCYPSDRVKKQENYLLPIFLRMFGARMWIVKHLANDWLAATWLILCVNTIFTFLSFLLMLVAMAIQTSSEQIFVWTSGFINSLLFEIGSIYYVSGSYPHAQAFYYATDRGRSNSMAPAYIPVMEEGGGAAGVPVTNPMIPPSMISQAMGRGTHTKSQTIDLSLKFSNVIKSPIHGHAHKPPSTSNLNSLNTNNNNNTDKINNNINKVGNVHSGVIIAGVKEATITSEFNPLLNNSTLPNANNNNNNNNTSTSSRNLPAFMFEEDDNCLEDDDIDSDDG